MGTDHFLHSPVYNDFKSHLRSNTKPFLNQTACANFPNVLAECHICGGTHPGAMTPNSNSVETFVQCTYPQTFIILCLLIEKLSCWQTNPQTNRCRWKHPMFSTTLQRWVIDRLQNHGCQNLSAKDLDDFVFFIEHQLIIVLEVSLCLVIKLRLFFQLWNTPQWFVLGQCQGRLQPTQQF